MLSPTEEIKSKLDIVDVIQEYFPLKQAGVNHKANCPFHQEKTPSFMVNREKQFYHCFGCQKSGDVFTFIQEMEGVEFPEALKILANKAGVKLPAYNPREANLRTRILDLEEAATDWFCAQLVNTEAGKKALSYLKDKRQLSEVSIKEWKLGYALDSWDALSGYLKGKGFSDEEILQSGLVVPKEKSRGYYDRFRDRVMFPIEDYHGNIVGFTGRALKEDESAKYINTPQTIVYNKSEVIFGLYKAKQFIREKDKVVVVEGNMDAISSYAAGVKNTVAVSGTALTSQQIKILQRYTNNIIFAFDADEAGLRAAERSISMAWQEEANTRVIAIDSEIGKDPDDIIRRDVTLWQELIRNAVSAMDYFFQINFVKYKPDEIESKKEIAKILLNLIIKLVNPVERDFYIKKLAEKLDTNEMLLREAIDKALKQESKKTRKQESKKTINPEIKKPTDQFNQKVLISERLLACLMLDREYMEYANDNLLVEHLPVESQELYKLMVVYYTKQAGQDIKSDKVIDFIKENSSDLTVRLNKMIILTEGDLRELSHNEIIMEIKRSIWYLKKEFIKNKLKQIQKDLKESEKELAAMNNREERTEQKVKIDGLLARFSELSAELKED